MSKPITSETDPLVAELRNLAYSLEQEPGTGSWAALIHDAADRLEAEPAPEPAPEAKLCGKTDPRVIRHATPCDRPERHSGACAWMADRRLRMLAEYQDEAMEARSLRVERDAYRAEARSLRADLAYLTEHTRPWWARIFGGSAAAERSRPRESADPRG